MQGRHRKGFSHGQTLEYRIGNPKGPPTTLCKYRPAWASMYKVFYLDYWMLTHDGVLSPASVDNDAAKNCFKN